MIGRLLRLVLAGVSTAAILLFLYLAFHRVPSPVELDPIEGVMMDHIVRLAEGQPLYLEPNLDFIPLACMPGFAALASLLAQLFGPHFWEPRLLSLLAILGTALVAARVVHVETDSRLLALASAGVLLGAFGVSGSHYDVGRPDALMLFLSFSGLALLRFTSGAWGALGAALLLTLAFFTQPLAGGFVIAALLHLAFNDRWRLLPFVLGIALGCGGGYALLARWLGPWFTFFTWEVPSHGLQASRERILDYLRGGLIGRLGPLAVPSLLALALPTQPWRGRSGQWMWVGLGAIATDLVATFEPDGLRHAMTPTVLALAVLGPMALTGMVNHLAAWPGSERPGRSWVLHAVLLVQFLPLVYSWRDQMPRPRAREAHQELLARLRAYPGRVLVFSHGHYAWQAGKGSAMHQVALEDLVRARGNSLLERDPQFVERLFEGLRRGADRPTIVTDFELGRAGIESRPLWETVAPHYRLEGELGWISEALQSVNGNRWRPRYVYVPRDQAADPTSSIARPSAPRDTVSAKAPR